MQKRLSPGLFDEGMPSGVQLTAPAKPAAAAEVPMGTSYAAVPGTFLVASPAAVPASVAAPAMVPGGSMVAGLSPQGAVAAGVAVPTTTSMSHAAGTAQSLALQRTELLRLSEDIKTVKGQMRSFENQLDVMKHQMSDFMRSVDQRFERVSQALSRIEKSTHQVAREGDEKIKSLREKIQNQSFEESKIEGLIERQNLVIRNFENRLSSMQKIIHDKEALLMKYSELLRRSNKA